MIRSWDYDEAERRLHIRFVSGRQYSYHAVPPRVADQLRKAVSKGRYFNRRIRDRFDYTEYPARASLAD